MEIDFTKLTFESDKREVCPKCGKNSMHPFFSANSQLVVDGIDKGNCQSSTGMGCLLCGYDEYTKGNKPSPNVSLQFSGKILKEMEDLLQTVFKESSNFYVSRNLTAGTRLRVALLKIVKIANTIRKDVSEAKTKIKKAKSS